MSTIHQNAYTYTHMKVGNPTWRSVRACACEVGWPVRFLIIVRVRMAERGRILHPTKMSLEIARGAHKVG